MRFLRDALITVLLLATAAGFAVFAVVRSGGLAANQEPSRLERSVAGRLVPAWKEEHSPEDTWELVAFLRKAPSLTEADLETERAVPTTGEVPASRQPETPSHRHRR
jgi:hypothetical protein